MTSAFSEQMKALMPRGRAWSRDPSSLAMKVLNGISVEFVRVQDSFDTLLSEMNPGQANTMLPEHEKANGLPDPCNPVIDTVTNRQAALLAKIGDNRGHNEADYLSVASEMGYPSAAVYRNPYAVSRAGLMRAGSSLRDDAYAHSWLLAYMTQQNAAQDFAGSWSEGAYAAWAPDFVTAPSGTGTADYCGFLAGVATVGTLSPLISQSAGSRARQVSFWAVAASADWDLDVAITSPSGGGFSHVERITLSSLGWKRYVVRSPAWDVTQIRVEFRPASTDEVRYAAFWRYQVGNVDRALECRIARHNQQHASVEYRVVGDTPIAT